MQKREDIVCFFICPNCQHKTAIFGPLPIAEFLKILKKKHNCDVCGTEIKNVTACDKK